MAQLFLRQSGIEIAAYVSTVGDISCPKNFSELDLSKTFSNDVHCPDEESAAKMTALIEEVRKSGDTVGGIVTAVVKNCPVGLGAPVFDKLHADLGKAMLSINAAKGFEIGSGFAGVSQRGSSHNDPFVNEGGKIKTTTNNSGGVQGGISNGMPIYFRVAFKPVATIMKEQASVDKEGNPANVTGRGRHDPCVLPRAVAIVEAMTALTIADHLLRQRMVRL